MANLTFDFNKIDRSFMPTKLKDGRTVVVKMPMKATFEKMQSIQEMNTEEMSVDDAMDTLGGICADILSNNMAKEKVTAEYMTGNYDTEEMKMYLDTFMNFVNGVRDNPN